jgi:hypothetical protein
MLSYPVYPNSTPDGEQGGDTEGGDTDSEGTYNYPNPAPDGEQGGEIDTEGTYIDNQQRLSSSAQEIAAAQKWIEEQRVRRDANRKPYEQRRV